MNPTKPSGIKDDSVSDKALMEAAMHVKDEPTITQPTILSKAEKKRKKKARQDAKRARRKNRRK